MSATSQTTTTQEKKEPSKMEVLKGLLNAPTVAEQFKNALKENSGAFVASIIEIYGSTPMLQECKQNDVVMECLKAATLKLPINKSLGFAYIIPYNVNTKINNVWTKVVTPQFQLGYKGYIQLAQRTGQYDTLNADVVYEGQLTSVNKLTGEIAFDGVQTSDKVVGYFCYFRLLNGFSKTLYMTVEQVKNHAKKRSKTYDPEKGIWATDFDAMAIKTVTRLLLSKYGFLSIEMQGAVVNDTDEFDENQAQISQNNASKPMDITNIQIEGETAPKGEQPKSEDAPY